MKAPILIEGRNLVLAEGTGIATYAAVLAKTLASLGHELDVLFDAGFALSRRDAGWNETRLFDAAGRQDGGRQALDTPARFAEMLHADPFGVDARPVGPSAAVIADSLFPDLAPFEQRQAVTRLFRRAETHLMRYRRRLAVRPVRQPRLFHATHPTPIRVAACPNVQTIHDLVPLRLPHATLDAKRAYAATLTEIARTADRIVTVSEHSRRDIVRFLGLAEDRVVNTYQASRRTSGRRVMSEADRRRELLGLGLEPDGYFLFVGAIEPKKNVERLVDAYLASGVGRPLVLAGRDGWSHQGVDRRLDALARIEAARPASLRRRGGYPRIVRLPYLPESLLRPLVESASALLFPSLYEGFGLPVLEAMQLGTPVLAGRAAALPELVGDAGRLVDPADREAIAAEIRGLDADDDLRAELARRGPARAALFSAERYRERIEDLYAALL